MKEFKSLVLSNAKVITMENPTILESMDIFITDGVIKKIIPHDTNILDEVNSIDCSDKYIIPGLHDCHTHIENADSLMQFLSFGVTGIINMMGISTHKKWQKEISDGHRYGCDIYTCGPIIDGTSKYAQLIDLSASVPALQIDDKYQDLLKYPGLIVAKDVKTAKKAVEYTKLAGYDFVKIYNNICPEVYSAIVEEAHKQGIKVMGHMPDCTSSNFTSQDKICKIQQQSIEHICNIIESDMDNILSSEAYIDGTLMVEKLFFYNEINSKDYKKQLNKINPIVLEKWAISKEKHMAAYKDKTEEERVLRLGFKHYSKILQLFKQKGGRILSGTDAGIEFIIPGYTLHKELQYLVECGLTPYEALYSSTVEASRFLEKSSEVGTISIGKKSNLLILNKNPLEYIQNTLAIHAVIKGTLFLDDNSRNNIIEQSKIKSYEDLEYAF